MKHKIPYILLICFLVFAVAVFLANKNEDKTEKENETTIESQIVLEEFLVNGKSDNVVVGLDESSVITAVVTNQGEAKKEITMSVKMDGDTFDRRHTWNYIIEPGETKEIEEVRENHHTWYKGSFTVELLDEIIEVIVE